MSALPDYKPTFPQWSRQDLEQIVSTLDEAGLDFLKVYYGSICSWFSQLTLFLQRSLTYDSAKRISGEFSFG